MCAVVSTQSTHAFSPGVGTCAPEKEKQRARDTPRHVACTGVHDADSAASEAATAPPPTFWHDSTSFFESSSSAVALYVKLLPASSAACSVGSSSSQVGIAPVSLLALSISSWFSGSTGVDTSRS